MILLSELSRRRIRSINKLIRVGRNECVVVIRVDKDKGKVSRQIFIMITIYSSLLWNIFSQKVTRLTRSNRCAGYIDLSKRRVSAEDIVKCEEKFAKARAVNSILRHVAERLDYSPAQLEELYKKTAWHFDEKLKKVTAGHDVFKAAVT